MWLCIQDRPFAFRYSLGFCVACIVWPKGVLIVEDSGNITSVDEYVY